MRQIGRKCRAFLFYVFTDCIVLHRSSEAAQAAHLRRQSKHGSFQSDSLNQSLFWALLEDFKGAIGLKKAVRDSGAVLNYEFLKTYLHGRETVSSPQIIAHAYRFISVEPEVVVEDNRLSLRIIH